MARSIAAHHRPKPFTGRCAGCREPWPCRDTSDAQTVLDPKPHVGDAAPSAPDRRDSETIGLLTAIALLLLVAAASLAYRVIMG